MADHTPIVTEVQDLMQAGHKAAAARLIGRYTQGADSALAEDLQDRAQTALDRETEAYVARLSEARRERVDREVAQPISTTRTRTGERQKCRTRAQARAEKHTAAYFAQRDTNTPDTDRRDEAAYGSNVDYDQAAVPAQRGAGCLVCGIERSNADRAHKDGLCVDHREDGMTRADGFAVRCAALVARALKQGRVSPRDALIEVWRRANTVDRALIEQWISEHPEALTTPTARPARAGIRRNEPTRSGIEVSWQHNTTNG